MLKPLDWTFVVCRAGGGKEERGAAVSGIQEAAFAALKGKQYASRWPNLDDITVRASPIM
jgi:hypothetical protein